MKYTKDIKEIVREKYGKIASEAVQKGGCGCGCGSSQDIDYSVFSDNYEKLDGYVAEADLGLGCGLPTEYAGIKNGDIVVDLGSGAGNDVFVARALTGESGRVIGVDMTEDMVRLARKNSQKLGLQNVEFHLGDIEKLPVDDNSSDVVISNCVLNLVPDKKKAFSEINRILKSGGHFCISDVVLHGELPAALRESAIMYTGCVAGALQQDEYLDIIKNTGFEKVEIKKSKIIALPENLLKGYLNDAEIKRYHESNIGVYSITVAGFKK